MRLFKLGLMFFFIALMIFITSLFLTPSFTRVCTNNLLVCVHQASTLSLGSRLYNTLICAYHNVICVLGGLFV